MKAQTQNYIKMKKLTSLERTQLVTKLVNEFRTVFTDPFTAEFLSLQMRSVDCPSANRIFSVLKNSHQIKKVSKGLYEFAFSEPVYYKAIQEELDKVVEAQREYQAKSDKKKLLVEDDPIQQAINLLKSNGYKIFKSVTTFEEV